MMNKLLTDITIAPSGGFTGVGTGPLANPGSAPIDILSNFISTVIGFMTVVAFIWFTFVFITGAISIIGSGGDKNALEAAKKKLTTGLIGLVITIAAVFIISLIGTIFGIDILNLGSLYGKLL